MRTGWRRSALVLATLALVAAPIAPAVADDWPMFHRDRLHSGLSPETTPSDGTAPNLGVLWQANTGASSFSSPAVAFNAELGKAVVYVGNQGGKMQAYDAATGERLWVYSAGGRLQSSPAVSGNTVYFGSSNGYLFAVNAATGTLRCRFFTGGTISASPVVVDPDGTGKVVYFGDNGDTGEDDGGAEWAVNAVDPNPAVDCSRKWVYRAFGDPPGSEPLVGSWSPPAFAEDRFGRPLIVFGSSSPEGAVYALDAVTGVRVWRFQTRREFDSDVGAAPTISLPGVNDFLDGVVYVAGKNKVMYALNLRTGAKIWEFDIFRDSGVRISVRSTAALVAGRLIFGYGDGVYAIDAVTGSPTGPGLWRTTGGEVVSSPAVSGPSGDRVVFAGNTLGRVLALDAGSGATLWSFATGSFIYSSPAISNGTVFIASSNGYLYAFAPKGGLGDPPDTTITEPSPGETVANAGTVTLRGTASDATSVASVLVAIKDRNENRWWNPVSGTWTTTFTQARATLASPGARTTTWTFSLPVTPAGGVFLAQAEAVDGDGLHDPEVPTVRFGAESLVDPPNTTITDPEKKQVFHFPVDGDPFTIHVVGTATDTEGDTPGVDHVLISVRNIDHGEYYCGSPGCGSAGGSSAWRSDYAALFVPVSAPGATSTTWSFSFTTYDHPHNYRIRAWAVDEDGNEEVTRATVRVCVNAAGDETCL
jgi:outer membrane protein assembly factor BamB